MKTVAAVLAIARSQLGVEEQPAGSNEQPFSAYWHHPAEAWCADYATWVLDQAKVLDVAQSSYTPTLAQHYRDAGRWSTTPRVGSLVFFQWPGMGRIAHVGIVEAIRPDGSIITIEGNTDEAGGRTGGKVMRKVRRANIAGYGHPDYATPPAPKPHVGPPWFRRNVGRGMTGGDVRWLEHHYKLPLTNHWSTALERAVRADRIRYRLPLDHGNIVDLALATKLKG